jgi:CBS domain-containing protein
MTIGQIARDHVVTASEEDTIEAVLRRMKSEDVGSVIIESDGEPVGIVTDRQVALAIPDNPDLLERRVADVMTTGLVTVNENDGVTETIEAMQSASVRRLPVVDDQGELVGILSFDDVVVLLTEEFDDLQEIVKTQSPRF